MDLFSLDDLAPSRDSEKGSKRKGSKRKNPLTSPGERILSGHAKALEDGGYTVVVADPPWDSGGLDKTLRGAGRHYRTDSQSNIEAVPVSQWTADDSILLLWVPNGILKRGFAAAEAWGYSVRTVFPWIKTGAKGELDKIQIGMGALVRQVSEIVLVGTKGKPSAIRKGYGQDSTNFPRAFGIGLGTFERGEDMVLYAPRKRHSEKPLTLYEALEAGYKGPKLDLYARRPKDGFVSCGDELGIHIGPEGLTAIDPKPNEAPIRPQGWRSREGTLRWKARRDLEKSVGLERARELLKASRPLAELLDTRNRPSADG